MDSQGGSINNSIASANNSNAEDTVPTQVLFMDSHDIPSRTNAHTQPTGYYQVATPKSPHELILEEEAVAHTGVYNDTGSHHTNTSLHSDDDSRSHGSIMRKVAGESEETERLKYETAKNEILEKLHLQTLISHKEIETIHREIKRVDAQMKLLRKLHDDKDLLTKVEEYHERQNESKRRQFSEANTVANSSGYYADSSSSMMFPGASLQRPLSASSNIPTHHYHTRSKSNGNVTEIPHLRPANSAIIDIRMAGSKSIPPTSSKEPGFEIHPFRPNQMNLHHRRNYSSTCLTSNSGVVGKTEQNEAIFRRYDGILIVITCSNCKRSGFTSAQGIVNHARLKHNKTYSSQPLAVLNNQRLLEDEKQDSQILAKFKELGKDPQTEYLPSEVAIPCSGPKSSQRELSPNDVSFKGKERSDLKQNPRITRHLEKLYNKEDFKDLVEMVNGASKDLEEVLKESSNESGTSESEDDNSHRKSETMSDFAASSVKPASRSSELSSTKPESQLDSGANPVFNKETPDNHDDSGSRSLSPTSTAVPQRKDSRKRKDEQRELEKDLKERRRPAEKKARPDVLALTKVPEHDKRSSHYNLRAKSKLRSHTTKDQ